MSHDEIQRRKMASELLQALLLKLCPQSMKNLIDYRLPNELVRKQKVSKKDNRFLVAHVHFIYGQRKKVKGCKYCEGVNKPVYTPEEIAERKRMKYQYYLQWKEKQEQENWDNLTDEERHIRDIQNG